MLDAFDHRAQAAREMVRPRFFSGKTHINIIDYKCCENVVINIVVDLALPELTGFYYQSSEIPPVAWRECVKRYGTHHKASGVN